MKVLSMIRNHSFIRRKMPRVLAQVALFLLFITCIGHTAGAMGWWTPKPKTELTEVTAFGSNPGNLKMYMYAPANVPDNAPLVVVLHGCTQNANEYAERTQWNRLAERFGFIVIYPEQQVVNNVLFCFNWFFPADASRDKGESLSIKQMIDRVKTDHSIDAERVYVTGLSAGGYMTAVMLAVYPEMFAGGAVMAGGPFRCATDAIDAQYRCMKGLTNHTPEKWGDLVRSASDHQGPFPILTAFHGDMDPTVNDQNMIELVEQWTNIHDADLMPDEDDLFRGHTHRIYHDDGGRPVVETYHIKGMLHAVSVDPGSDEDQGGTVGAYAEDRDVYSAFYAAKFWGLINP
jgi:poly(hydroxyalkanoate) depolymerase family esterase